jgi:hypothetical protein
MTDYKVKLAEAKATFEAIHGHMNQKTYSSMYHRIRNQYDLEYKKKNIETARKAYLANKEKINKRTMENRKANAEEWNAYQRKYYATVIKPQKIQEEYTRTL